MKAEEIRGLSDDELTARIAEMEEERFRLKFRSASEALEEPLRLRSIARLQTVRRERALGITRVAAAPKAAAKAPAKKAAAKKAAAKKATKASGR